MATGSVNFNYCPHCAAPLLPASILEIRQDQQKCKRCEAVINPNRDLYQYAEALELRVAYLENLLTGNVAVAQ